MAQARIDSWWRLPTVTEADEAARSALEAMPWTEGLIRFSVLRSPSEPTLFLQSLWSSAAARDHYVHHVAVAPRAAVDERVPRIERDRSLTDIAHVVELRGGVAGEWVTRRLSAHDTGDAMRLADDVERRLRTEHPDGLVRVTVAIGRGEADSAEVIVIEEWEGSAPAGDPTYRPVGAVEPAM